MTGRGSTSGCVENKTQLNLLPTHNKYVADIVVEIPVNNDQVTQDEPADRFSMEIQAITTDLENYGFELCRKVGTDMLEYQKKCGCFNAVLSESIDLIKVFHGDSAFFEKGKYTATCTRQLYYD